MKRKVGLSPAERIERMSIPEPNSGCWLWMGALTKGYGMLWIIDRAVYAHRASWLSHRGPIPNGCEVLHKCDNAICVNPDHLEVGSHKKNMEDMSIRGRCETKLSIDRVQSIRRDTRPQPKIAQSYGISQSLVSMIKNGKRRALV